MICVRVIESTGEWQAIAPEWSALVDRCPGATPFQRPEWLLPWWRSWGSGELFVLEFRIEGRLAGLMPMFIHPWNGCRQVTLAGNGMTDFLGLIAEQERAMQCANLAFETVARNRERWDLCDWQDLAANSTLLTASPFGLEVWPIPHEYCTRTKLPGNAEELNEKLPHGLRRSIRVARRRLERSSDLRFETECHDDHAEIAHELIALHERRWAIQGGPESMLDTARAQAFLIEAVQQMAGSGRLRMYTMRYDGQRIAIVFGVLDRARLFGYITGFDPAYARFSPGSLVLDYAMREAIGEGARSWEFLRGREPYKYLWGAEDVPKYRMYAWHDAAQAPARETVDETAVA
jgi:CelD/BcsL family acetyltransferase involved in cellulose biosynthesis